MFKFFPFRKLFEYFWLLMIYEYRQIYNTYFIHDDLSLLFTVLKALMGFTLKLPQILFKRLILSFKKSDFNIFDLIEEDTTIPVIETPQPDYKVFDPEEDIKDLPSRILFGINDKILGHGWYNVYKEDVIAYRWFGKRAHTYLKIEKEGKNIIQIHISAPLSILKVPTLSVYLDGKKVGETMIHSPKNEWHTLHFPVEIHGKDYVKITLELDDFVSIQNLGWTHDFGCTVNEISILEPSSPLLRANIAKPEKTEGLSQKKEDEHLTYQYRITDFRYEMELLERSEVIDGRSHFYLVVRVKNTSECPWLIFHHNTKSYVSIGMRLFDSKNKHYPRKMQHFKLKKNIFPGDEDTMTLLFYPILKKGPYTLRVDMIEEFVCWFEEKGAKPLNIEVNL
jgi:hypothetical protein